MRRLRDMDGSVIVFALVALVVVGVIAGYTLTRTTDNERRTGNERVYNASDAAVEAGLASAIARIQRVGSSNGASFERDDSVLDIDDWHPIDGIGDNAGMTGGASAEDDPTSNGSYKMQVRAGVEGCERKRQRLVTVSGIYQGTERRRYLCVTVIPRILRYALYSGGVPDATDESSPPADSTALEITGHGNLLLPPYYKAQTGVRGGDIGSNGPVDFDANAAVNYRDADPTLYDDQFPSDSTTFSLGALFRGAGSSGVSDAPEVRADNGGGSLAPITTFPDSTGRLNLNGDVITLATRTRFPDVSQLIPIWRASAVDNPNNDAVFTGLPEHDDTGSLVTRDDFAELVSGGNISLYGIVYVDCRNEPGDITISGNVTVHQGALIVDGCNLIIAPNGNLKIDRDLSRANAPVARSNKPTGREACRDNKGKRVGEHDELSGENNSDMYTDCLWNYPALAVLQHNDNVGGRPTDFARRSGSLISHAQGSHNVTVDGVIWVARNLTIDAATPAPAGRANFVSNGAVAVGGKATIGGDAGTANVVLKWHPLAQRMFYDADDARMGTYTVRTNDQPMATERPTVVLVDKPDDPSFDRHVRFTWQIVGDYDNVRCRVLYSDEAQPRYVPCESTSYEGDLRGYLLDGVTFQVQACVLGVDEGGNQTQLCNRWWDVDDGSKYEEEADNSAGKLVRDKDNPGDDSSYTWTVSGPAPKVTFTDTAPDQGTEKLFTFRWAVTEENDDGSTTDVTAVREQWCQLDDLPAYQCGPGAEAVSPITVGTHTFRVRAINEYTTGPWATYTWERKPPPPPEVIFVETPEDPTIYGDPNHFIWEPTGGDGQYDTVTCTIDDDPVDPCLRDLTLNGLASGYHTFTVEVCNDGGCGDASYTWRVKLDPPTGELVSCPTGNQPGGAASGPCTWTQSEYSTATCSLDGSPFTPCSSTFNVPFNNTTGTGAHKNHHTFTVRISNESGSIDLSTNFVTAVWDANAGTPTVQHTAVFVYGPPPYGSYYYWVWDGPYIWYGGDWPWCDSNGAGYPNAPCTYGIAYVTYPGGWTWP